jgi:hypothetical protein
LTQNADFTEHRIVPGFAKAIMLLQMLVIVLLSSWIVEEYLNNIYLQAYVNDVVQADGSLIAILITITGLGAALGLLKVLKSTHSQIGALVNQPQVLTSAPVASSSKPMVDLHPMVAALRADLAHQASMEPLPPVEVKEAPRPTSAPVQPNPAPVRTQMGTPSTVITGTMPVLKRVNSEQDRRQNSNQ